MATAKALSLLWLRRDLRLHDNAAFFHAFQNSGCVQPVFVFDSDILSRFSNKNDRRLSFIAEALCQLDKKLMAKGGRLLIIKGRAVEIIPKLAEITAAEKVFAAEDYEPYALKRDAEVAGNCRLSLVKDHVIFAPSEVLKSDGLPFKVYTPYARVCQARLSPASAIPYNIADDGRYADYGKIAEKIRGSGINVLDAAMGSEKLLAEIGYSKTDISMWPVADGQKNLQQFISAKAGDYGVQRDMVANDGTSRISPYLRFGLISVREAVAAAVAAGANKWLSELIWREFYAMILFHSPESADTEWNSHYRGRIKWSDNKEHLERWKCGQTGYPMVDAAMRQLLATGWMHNRARMVVASFLTKHLLIDWRHGEEHFAQHLMDYEQASNVGGWQWAASTGTDAQPWFRIFNPYLQSRKFDPDGEYIRRYVPELSMLDNNSIHQPEGLLRKDYPQPMVEHAAARLKALAAFSKN